MDHSALSSEPSSLICNAKPRLYYFLGNSVLEILLKTNRPPTDEEKAILDGATVPRNAKLKGLQAQISETVSRIQALNSQVEEATSKLWSLSKGGIGDLDNRRKPSSCSLCHSNYTGGRASRNLHCMRGRHHTQSMLSPNFVAYNLAQISRGMRHIALNTPILWARMDVPYFHNCNKIGIQGFYILARKATQWFKRAGQLPLTLSIEDPTNPYAKLELEGDHSEHSHILFNTVLRFSSRFKEIIFNSRCHSLSIPILNISALTAVDLPMLESVSLNIVAFNLHLKLPSIGLLTLPTLKCLSLETEHLRGFEINWAVLTSVSLRGKDHRPCYTRNELAGIFQQTKRLVFCDVIVASDRAGDENYPGKIALPFLETLYVNEITFGTPTSGARSLLDLITAPALQILRLSTHFLKFFIIKFSRAITKNLEAYSSLLSRRRIIDGHGRTSALLPITQCIISSVFQMGSGARKTKLGC